MPQNSRNPTRQQLLEEEQAIAQVWLKYGLDRYAR